MVNFRVRRRCLLLSILAGIVVGAEPPLQAAEFMTNPVGFNKILCRAGSDTVVSVPFVRQPSLEAKVQTAVNPAQNRIQLAVPGNTNWTNDQFANTHYVRFITGDRAGQWYDVVNNGANTLTVDTAGDNLLANVAPDDRFLLAPYWTLDALFPPADQNGGPGSVIHPSASDDPTDRATEVELPNLSEGTNLPPGSIFYLENDGWHAASDGSDAASTIIPPGSSFIIRHPIGLAATTFTPTGSVLMNDEAIALATSATGFQDNEIGILRPVPVKLSDSQLATAIVPSTGHLAFQHRDALFVPTFNESRQAIGTISYYYIAPNWYRDEGRTSRNPMANDDVIPAGSGFVIRKFKSAAGASDVWINPANVRHFKFDDGVKLPGGLSQQPIRR